MRNLESNIHLQVSGVHGSERPFRGIQGATKTLPETNKFEKLPNLKRKLIIDSDFTDFSGGNSLLVSGRVHPGKHVMKIK